MKQTKVNDWKDSTKGGIMTWVPIMCASRVVCDWWLYVKFK